MRMGQIRQRPQGGAMSKKTVSGECSSSVRRALHQRVGAVGTTRRALRPRPFDQSQQVRGALSVKA